MVQRFNAMLKSWYFIGLGGFVLLLLLFWQYGIDVLVRVWPPYQTSSLVVVTAHGVPARVIETRRIVSEFNGTWRVRVVDVENSRDFCTLPARGPKQERYRESERPTYGDPWSTYTGDYDYECLHDMQAKGSGLFQLETQRTMRALGRDVDLPLVVSAPFQVY